MVHPVIDAIFFPKKMDKYRMIPISKKEQAVRPLAGRKACSFLETGIIQYLSIFFWKKYGIYYGMNHDKKAVL